MPFGFWRRKKPADPQLWRQGDVFITRVESIPDAARASPLRHGILAHGELTGHSHRLDDAASAALFGGAGHNLFLDVGSGGAGCDRKGARMSRSDTANAGAAAADRAQGEQAVAARRAELDGIARAATPQ